ncbi:hypothetical protein B0T16DRAFT_393829 [Cercophora newfieldiana]|uniref:Uncharacterized protein n=1 Tax=Cercophora newfieldiana TaxID=92897 RepID=A0AA40CL82_9PEZI|nr:hypothetical protein B0T16DRAFT_393829 [Cercophora newfieldiana]
MDSPSPKSLPTETSSTLALSVTPPETPVSPAPPQPKDDPTLTNPNLSKEPEDHDHNRPYLRLNTTSPILHPSHAQPWHPLAQAHHLAPFTPISPPPTAAPATSLEDLHHERTYLLHNLQRQGERATRLLERYATLEAKPPPSTGNNNNNNTTTGKSTTPSRKTRKELATLKARLAESSRQEQLMLLRLGEIWLEVKNRERWLVAAHRHVATAAAVSPGGMAGTGTGIGLPATPSTAGLSTTSTEYFACSSALSPLSPAFEPGRPFSEQDIWGRVIASEKKEDVVEQKKVEDKEEKQQGGGVGAGKKLNFMAEEEEEGDEKGKGDNNNNNTCAKNVMFDELRREATA